MNTLTLNAGSVARLPRFSRITRMIEAWRMERRTRIELEGLSERELNDIGLSRADIAMVARQSV